ncbi:hypothetical protein NliqN6_3895 [Naganishia liquefaciens]|uniref:Serine/threonine-protein kinase RIO2 n=1 Tax=Naganishia liquefaciens TaxID=104408 RepID=A0A8H3TUT1_9TREE|nr:hypothetical protein NliqN6_3895 [Naganishia liquefaciens]
MKLDATDLRYVTPDEFRVLAAVEQGSKNHEVIPTVLIAQISKITGGQVNKCLGALAKRGLVGRVANIKYDGYRLTYGGLDFLALKAFSKRSTVTSVGQQIGVGKEGDIYIVKGSGSNAFTDKGKGREEDGDEEEEEEGSEWSESEDEEIGGSKRILKIHRLGRISFRNIKTKRDYLGSRKSASWMYMSRLSAMKEYEYMKALYQYGLPVPKPYDNARHAIVMSLVEGFPMRQLSVLDDPSILYSKLMSLIVRLAYVGLIHGDFNEFNIMIGEEDDEPTVIDFPQMVSIRHENAESFFDRDVQCIRRFFRRRFRYESDDYPTFQETMRELKEMREEAEQANELFDEDGVSYEDLSPRKRRELLALKGLVRIDELVEASGFGRQLQEELETYMHDVAEEPGENDVSSEGSDDSEESEDDSDQEQDDVDDMEQRARDLRLGNTQSEDDEDEDEHEDEDEDEVPELHDHGAKRGFPSAPSSVAARSHMTGRTNTSRTTQGSRTSRTSEGSDLKSIVANDLARQRQRTEGKHHTRKGLSSAGRAKGSKWKTSASAQVGRNAAQGGIWN